MTAATTPPLHVLRGILRSLPKNNAAAAAAAPASASTQQKSDSQQSSSLRQHILSQYRESKSVPPQKASTLRILAYDYWTMKKDLVERARLYELDMGAEDKLGPKEMSRRAAARAGLQLPKLDAEA